MNILHELLNNVAIVAITVSVWTMGQRHLSKLPSSVKSLAFGALLAVGTAGAMLLPVVLPSGVILDLRYTFLVIAGFFGGPLATILPTAVALALRIAAGGTGLWVGIPLIMTATTCGLVGYFHLKGRIPGIGHILALALAAAFSGTAGFFVMIPMEKWPLVIPFVTAPLGVLLFVSTTVAAFAVATEMRRQQATHENRVYRSIIEALPDCLNAKDLQGRFIAANPATADLMGAGTLHALIGKTDADFYDADTARQFQADEQMFIAERRPIAVEQRFKRQNGLETWLSTLKAPLFDEDGLLVGLITHNREITEQKKLEIQLTEAQGWLSDALASMADGLVMYDDKGTMLFCNEQYRAFFPSTSDAPVAGPEIRSIIRAAGESGERPSALPSETDADQIEAFLKTIKQSEDREISLPDGRVVAARTRQTGGGSFLVVLSDISASKEAERQLLHLNRQLEAMANTDGLTGLLNRRAFDRMLDETIADGKRRNTALTLLLIDIDSFKAFNDTYGHPEGDKCLQRVSQCLLDTMKDFGGGSVARYGGEEIGVILPHAGEEDGLRLAELLRTAVKTIAIPHTGSEKKVVTISVGVAAGRIDDYTTSAEVLRRADEGLYAAKAAGRDRVRLPATVSRIGLHKQA